MPRVPIEFRSVSSYCAVRKTRADLYLGEAAEILSGLEAESAHSFILDPDYGLATNTGTGHAVGPRKNRGWAGWEKNYNTRPPSAYQDEVTEWATEALRVIVPGGHMVAFGAGRTIHRFMAGVEDAGWEIRELAIWHHNRGQLLGTQSRSADGAWSTKLRPTFDPIMFARKPIEGKHLLRHYEKWGTGYINIDAMRREIEGNVWPSTVFRFGKAHPSEIPPGGHTTVKPLEFMRYLVNAVTPVGPDKVVIDTTMGTGTTVEAALLEGRSAIGIDRVAKHIAQAEYRVQRARRAT